MIDQELLKKARKAANKDEKGMFEAEKIFLDHLSLYPQDTDVRIMLSLLLYATPWGDHDAALANLNAALLYEEDQIKRGYCLLIMAYICEHTFRIKEELYGQIVSLQITNPTILAMLEIAKAWYHRGFDNNILYEQCLKKSIEYDNTIARNYYELGKFYINKKHAYKEGSDLIRKAIVNVEKVSTDPERFARLQDSLSPHEKKIYKSGFSGLDNLSLEQFLDERYKMSDISDSVYGFMREYLN